MSTWKTPPVEHRHGLDWDVELGQLLEADLFGGVVLDDMDGDLLDRKGTASQASINMPTILVGLTEIVGRQPPDSVVQPGANW